MNVGPLWLCTKPALTPLIGVFLRLYLQICGWAYWHCDILHQILWGHVLHPPKLSAPSITKEIRVAKRSYTEKLKNTGFQLKILGQCGDACRTSPTTGDPPPHCTDPSTSQQHECVLLQVWSAHTQCTCSNSDITQPTAPPAISSPLSPDSPPALTVCEEDVCQVFQRQKIRKAPGSDGVSPSCLKVCADQLAPIFTGIFNRSLELC